MRLLKKFASGIQDRTILNTTIKSLEKNLNTIEIELINQMSHFVQILESYKNLPDSIIKKILFAMSYFIDDQDEIPDIIPKYGYLDDITVARWIINQINNELPEIGEA